MARKKIEIGPQSVKSDITPSQQIRQDIANLCTSIGDRSFVVRQAQSEIIAFYTQIDQLRDQLRVLEVPANGPETLK